MTHWEYRQVINSLMISAPELNRIGGEGWELVSLAIDGSIWAYVFKRPLY